jgi:hypothetical protein
MRAPKYRNVKTIADGIPFDSRAEARRYRTLVAMEQAGAITNLRRQVKFQLIPSVRFFGSSRATPALRYVADFVYDHEGRTVVEDVKSPVTRKLPAYRIKRHLMKYLFNIDILETR